MSIKLLTPFPNHNKKKGQLKKESKMTSQELNQKITKLNGWIERIDCLSNEMEDADNNVLPAHLDSVVSELEFEKTQLMIDHGVALMSEVKS